MCLFFIMANWGGRKDLSNLAFALICLMLIIIVLINGYYPKFKSYNPITLLYLRSLYTIIMGILVTLFAYSIFNLKDIKYQIKIIMVIYLISTIIVSTLYIILKYNFLYTLHFTIIALCGSVVLIISSFQIIKKKQYRDKAKRLACYGFFVLILQGILYAIFGNIIQLEFSYIVSYSLAIVVILLFSYSLATRFNKEHKDLSNLKQTLEKKVHEKTLQYYDANKQKTMLLINIAHETKTPLTIIKNYLDLYFDENETVASKEIIKSNINKIIRDIIQILDMEKMSNGSSFFNHTCLINLSELLQKRIEIFRSLAARKMIKIDSDIEDDLLVNMDPNAANIVVNNLLDNAIKYSRSKGRIQVSLTKNENDPVLTISDNGIGMEKDKLEKIFTPFYQISHKKNSFEGIGMGLSLTKRIIDDIAAEITAISEKNMGSTFKIVFRREGNSNNVVMLDSEEPLDTTIVFDEANFVISDSSYDRGKKNLFVVEDNKEMQLLFSKIFNNNFNFYFALNGTEALDKINTIPFPDLIISDIMMDEMDGLTFYNKFKKRSGFEHVPFIFVTAKTSESVKLQGMKEGAVDFIPKPFSKELLLAKIKSILSYQDKYELHIIKDVNQRLSDFLTKSQNNEKRKVKMLEEDKWIYFGKKYRLAAREIEVCKMILEGLQYKEIALKMDLSENTIETYRKRIFKKCNVQNKTELLRNYSEL